MKSPLGPRIMALQDIRSPALSFCSSHWEPSLSWSRYTCKY
jgi:hypothetical protein